MGRYTSVQAFSDSNTKLVSGYAGVTTTSSSSSSSNSNETNNGGTNNNTNEGHKPTGGGNKLVTERVHNVSGSCAGASSSEFDKYRAARNREVARLKSIELNDQQIVEAEINQQRLNKNKQEAEERERKNAEKRNKKKRKILKKRELSKLHHGKAILNDDSKEGIVFKDDSDNNNNNSDSDNSDLDNNAFTHKKSFSHTNNTDPVINSTAQDQDDFSVAIVKPISIHTFKRKSGEL